MNHFESRLLLAPHCPVCGWTRQPPIGACRISTAHDAIYASGPRGTSTPNLPTGSAPKGEHGRAPLQSRRVLKSYSSGAFLFPPKNNKFPPNTGFGAEPQVETNSQPTL